MPRWAVRRLFRRDGRTVTQIFDVQFAARHGLRGIHQIAAPWSGNSAGPQGPRHRYRQPARAWDGRACRRSFRPPFNHFAPQGGGEFDIDLLADNAPAQGIEPGGQQRHAQASPVAHEFGMAGLELGYLIGERQNPQRRAMQRRHAGPPQFSLGMDVRPRRPVSMLISTTAGPSCVCNAFQIRLPSLFSVGLKITGMIGQDFFRPVPGGRCNRKVWRHPARDRRPASCGYG